jgi:sulfonate transport system ATP-binding protein
VSKRVELDIKSKNVLVDGKTVEVLGNIACRVEAGSFVSIIGPSGCGKSTLLRSVMGLDVDYEGEIRIGDQRVRGPGVDRGIVFQEPRLLPWASVWDNISFALQAGSESVYATGQIERLIDLFGLREFANAWPNQLSGGMMQRVALARALVNLPEVLLMDEPFGALDALTRDELQREFLSLQKRLNKTVVFVTHDLREALRLGSKIALMNEGRLVTFVPPDEFVSSTNPLVAAYVEAFSDGFDWLPKREAP